MYGEQEEEYAFLYKGLINVTKGLPKHVNWHQYSPPIFFRMYLSLDIVKSNP